MPAPEREQTLALAGVFLALKQTRRVATHGQSDPRQTGPCLTALLGRYDGDVASLFGGADALTPGIHDLIAHLENPQQAELTSYLVAVLQLERRLTRHRRHFEHVREGLERAAAQAEYFGSASHPNVLSNLGDVYRETLSRMRPRIMVRGERTYLEEPRNAALIRALLLSAVRSAGLWRAAGGNRWRLIVHRRRLVENARSLLATT